MKEEQKKFASEFYESTGIDLAYVIEQDKPEDMNSELLATLLKQQNLASEVEGYRDEIDALFFTLA